MLKYRGHVVDSAGVCQCGQTHDARRLTTDPTGTRGIRRAFMADLDIRWRAVRRMVRTVVVDQDLLGRRGGQIGADSALRVSAFSDWLTSMTQTTVLDTGIIRSYVERASALGVRTASVIVGSGGATRGRTELITGLAVNELRAIGSLVAQQSARAVAAGLLQGWTTARVVREVTTIIDKVAIARSRLVADHVVVRSYNDATLDVFEQAGHDSVDVVPELRPAVRVGDARKTKKAKKAKKSRKTGPGSRVSRSRTPSGSTIRRIAKLEAETEAWAKRVNVETAEDDKVCSICLGIAEDGPYTINTARSLIPAHPRCRCAFVPVRRRVRVKDGTSYRFVNGEYVKISETRGSGRSRSTRTFNPAEHPREVKGQPIGGQFAEKPDTGHGAEVKVGGDGKHQNDIRKAISAVPEAHRKYLANTTFQSTKEVISKKSGRSVDGRYMFSTDLVSVADRTKGRATFDRVGVAMHEIGHAVDFQSGQKITRAVAASSRKEALSKMKPEEKYLAQYWLEQDVEMSAELYRLAYSPSNKGAFGMSRKRAERVFSSSLVRIKELDL